MVRAILITLVILSGSPGLTAPSVASSVVNPTKVLAQTASGSGNVYFPTGRDAAPGADRTLFPYLFIAGGDPQIDRLPLKETAADIAIAGVIARVRVRQLFENSGRNAIEAIYVFPASTRAAVHGMRMKIGTRVVEAKIDRRHTAREIYELARRQGQRAALLEQERPNVFSMSVANILPGDRIAVELDYSELLVPENAAYEFVYPAVVGPRYAGRSDPKRDQWMANPHLSAGRSEPYRFDLRVHLETGIPIKELTSPSHEIAVTYPSAGRADVRLPGPGGGNRDFVLRYRLSGDKIETGLLLWEDPASREGYFALMVEPPRRPVHAQIPPREYIFLLDVSGSVHGFPLDTAKALMRNLLGRLRPIDQFNLALFSGASYVMSPDGSLPATADNITRGISLIEKQRGGGGTELMGGLEASYRVPRRNRNVSRTVVVVTDGYVGVEARAFRFVRERLGEANLFAFGIGSSVNRGLIEGLARAGVGEPFIVLGPDKAAAQAERLRDMIEHPVLANVELKFRGFDALEVAPARVPDLLARRPLLAFGKYRGGAVGRIEVTGLTGTGRFQHLIDVHPNQVRPDNAALRWLWARKWVELLEDEHHMGGGKPIEEAIMGLGLAHNLLTAFTSFVAVDSRVANRTGQLDSVRQPLPMPEGVSDLASSGSYGRGAGALGAKLAAAPAPQRALAEESEKDEAQARPEPSKSAHGSVRFQIASARKERLTDDKPLIEAITTLLRAPLGTCAPALGVTMTLRLHVDARGRVIKVEVVSGNRALGRCMEPHLKSLASATRSTGSGGGWLEITLRQV